MNNSYYKLRPSVEEDRPQIDLEKHDIRPSDWGDMEMQFPLGVDTIKSPDRLRLHVDAPDALDWDWYSLSGWGAFSQRAKDLLWPHAKGCLRCFETSLNGAAYYILRLDEELSIDCLNLDRSKIEYYKSGNVYRILKYVFKPGIIQTVQIFHVPELPEILCTESVKKIIEEAGLRGFAFYDAARLDEVYY